MSNAISEPTVAKPATMPNLRWAIRRAVLGLTIMLLGVAGAACLFYFAIDGEHEARADTGTGTQSPGSFLYKLQRPAE